MKRKQGQSYTLRMPEGIRQWYEKESIANKCSLNAQLVKVLKDRMIRSKAVRNAKKKPQCGNTEA